MINLLLTLIGLGIIIPIDSTYLILNKNFYKPIIDPDEKINLIYAVVTWLIIIISIQLLVLSRNDINASNSFINGLFLGFATYGIYNFTSASLYPSKWTEFIIFGDTLWGTLLTGLISFILYHISYSNTYLSI
jgi:uncharacterized membrane protein